MSFLPILKDIGHVFETGIGEASKLSGVISLIPGGSLINTVVSSITAVEQLIPATGAGAAKKAAVTTIVNAAQPGIDQSKLSAVIDQIVAALNSLWLAPHECDAYQVIDQIVAALKSLSAAMPAPVPPVTS